MGWANRLIDWTDGNTAFVSVVFSWMLPKAYQRAVWYKMQGYKVRAGGPAITLNPEYLSQVAEIGGNVNALPYHNPDATFTTRGCIRKCSFCAVPKIEGNLIELSDDQWEPKPIICDNNLLASSIEHFDHVIDRLKASGIKGIDFNQGLDARLLTDYHARRLSELPKAIIRLAWDHIKTEQKFREAFGILTSNGVKPYNISVYVLIGYNDTPEDALYRFETIRGLGAWTNPARYQPLDALMKNQYVGDNWNERELRDMMRYWYRQKLGLKKITYTEYKKYLDRRSNGFVV